MNIAFFHELHFGGARRVVSEYANIFKKYHKTTLYYTDSDREQDIENKFHHVFPFSFKKYEYSGGNWKAKLFIDLVQPILVYFLHKRIAREIDKQNYDFVFVHPSQITHAPFVLRFLKTTTVYYCQEPLRIAHDPVVALPTNIAGFKKVYEVFIRRLKMVIDRANIRHADLVLTNSKYSKENIKNAYNINAMVCYLGVDCETFKPLRLKKTIDILFVGAPVWLEGYDTFQEVLKLFKIHPSIFIVKGEKGKFISDTDLVRKYNASKLVIVLGRSDPFTMIPLEGNACGVPIVGVNEGGTIEAIDNGYSGYLIERDPEKIYAIVKKLLSDNTLRDKLGKQGRKRDLAFWTWEKSYERCISIIKKQFLSKK